MNPTFLSGEFDKACRIEGKNCGQKAVGKNNASDLGIALKVMKY